MFVGRSIENKNWIGHVVGGKWLLKQVIDSRMEGKGPKGK